MATRRRGAGDLDDLKARLGLPDAGAAEAPGESPIPAADLGLESVDDADGSAADPFDAAAPASPPASESIAAPAAVSSSPAAAPAPPRPAPRPVPAAPVYDEDFASAVAPAESTEPVRLEAVSGADEKFSSGGLPIPLIVSAIVCLLVGLVMGGMAGSANTQRKLVNAKADGAQIVVGQVEPIATQLARLNGALGSLDAEARYLPDFDTTLREAFGGPTRPIVDPATLATASTRVLIAGDASLAPRLIAYAVNTQRLGELVDTHLRLTERDAAEIQRELSGAEDTRPIGIAFDFNGLVAAFNATFEDPTGAWAPPGGERVFLENTEPQTLTMGEGETATTARVYNVTNASGQAMQVPITDLVMIPRAQMLPATSTETAVTRYRARANAIKETLSQIVQGQGALVEGLRDAGAAARLSTF